MAEGSTVICGLEHVSLRVARALVQLGERVTIVADAPEPALLSEARRAGARVVQGRTSELASLHLVGLESARCLVLAEDSDLGNLHAAMVAREVNPRIRIVMRMFNADLADRATRLLTNSRLISTSAEAAPYFAADALGVATVSTQMVWGRHLVVDPAVGNEGSGPGGNNGTLASAAARLLAAFAGHSGGGAPSQSPVELAEGEFLHALEPPPRPPRRKRRRGAFLRALLAISGRRLGLTALTFALLIAVSTAIFHSASGLAQGPAGQPTNLSWLDALDLTVSAAFGNFDVHLGAWWVKVYVAVFTFTGALSLALVYALITDAVVGARIVQTLGVPRGGMRNHVVVLGLGNVGYRIVQHLLDAGVEVAAADSRANGRFVALARRQGVPVLIAEGRYSDGLRVLSVDRARAVIAASPDDIVNLEAALAARELNPDARVVARIFDQDLAERAQEQLRITACQSVSALATPAFVAAALGEGVLNTIERGRQLWLLVEVRVGHGSAAGGMRVDELEAAGHLRILAVRDSAGEHWRPHCPVLVEPGQEVLAACSRDGWERLRAMAAAPSSGSAVAGAEPR